MVNNSIDERVTKYDFSYRGERRISGFQIFSGKVLKCLGEINTLFCVISQMSIMINHGGVRGLKISNRNKHMTPH